jgi:hypothetical protein
VIWHTNLEVISCSATHPIAQRNVGRIRGKRHRRRDGKKETEKKKQSGRNRVKETQGEKHRGRDRIGEIER